MDENGGSAIDYVFRILDISWWYYGIAVAFGIGIWKWKGCRRGFLAAYTFLILVATVLIRKPSTGSYFEPRLFWSWRVWDIEKNQILANVFMFIPYGIISGSIWRWRGILVAASFSTFIELTQLVSKTGLCEFDDILHNTFGAMLGVLIFVVMDYSFLEH